MSDQATKKDFTVLPYTLGGRDDPFFIGNGNPPLNRPSQPNETEDFCGSRMTTEREDLSPSRTPADYLSAVPVPAEPPPVARSKDQETGPNDEAKENGEARESTTVATRMDSPGGTQTLGPIPAFVLNEDYWSLRDEGRSFGEGESYAERNA